ncbi:MAG: hypothetical protein AB7S49_04200 [Arcobacter sp.]|jgi:hypothetical protein|uniref:Uncharacterized protein n=1 Tax=Arcobacter defluvii TaxID=873191 RepID=A0AAE7E671_9BACT|nr:MULTISPECIES: hypothetical protein [Arcobacter]QKF77585.1 hypothetical protein ADFLV_1561 [Arcobacter defluvii]RXI31736.1 hypothetical protein CP964_09785 [Arcobacter defluvii]BAK73402.1 conserved hypothetical protein [Arcobacter sp. L]
MIISVDKDSLFNLFGVNNFYSLETTIDNMAPSLVEYHLSNFYNYNNDNVYFNKRDVEESVSIGEYNIYIDYDKNIYLEVTESNLDDNTQTLW